MEPLLDTTTLQFRVICFVVASVVFLIVLNKLTTWEYIVPSTVPWIDRRKEPFGYIRAKWRSFFIMKANIAQAYAHNKEGRPAALAIAFGRPQVILPPKYVRWIIDQPETVLSIDPIHNEFHAFVRDGIVGDHMVQEVLRKELAQHLVHLTPEMNEEIADSIDAVFDCSEEWVSLPLRDSMRTIIARISNRLFVGKTLCRNEDYIRDAIGLGMAVMPATVVQDVLPQLLKGPFSFVAKWLTSFSAASLSRHLRPLIQQRILEVQAAGDTDQLPNEVLTWMVRRALRRGEAAGEIQQKLISRLSMANLASIETTTNTIIKCLEDMTRLSEKTGGYLVRMKREAHAVLGACNGSPTKKDLEKLVHIENALKESLRLAVVFPGLIRQVTSPAGVTLEDGTYLPHGARISVAAYSIHQDEVNWPDAAQYNPTRHEEARWPMSKGSERLLSFGLGKRACPGRFFVTDELKLLFAHILTKYDFKVIKPPVSNASLLREITLRGPQEQLVVRRL